MKYVNIKTIMDRVTRHPLLKDIPFEIVVDYAIEFLRLVGIPKTFIEKVVEIPIENYRGELPCDFYEMIQVSEGSKCLPNNSFKFKAYRYSTDSFHMSSMPSDQYSDSTYKIQGNVIFTYPLKDGKIFISYRALPIDEEGYPLIPDNSAYAKALELYIKLEQFTVLFDTNKISGQVLANTQKEYAFAVGQASTDLIMPSIDQMESISNMWNKLLTTHNEHESGFKYLGTKEHYKNH